MRNCKNCKPASGLGIEIEMKECRKLAVSMRDRASKLAFLYRASLFSEPSSKYYSTSLSST